MLLHSGTGRAFGLASCFVILSFTTASALAGDASASPGSEQVAAQFKAERMPGFLLADYAGELVDCSALAAIHTWMGDAIGEDEGFAVRQAIASDYWIEVSNGYLSLAQQSSGAADLQPVVGARMRELAADWRHLTESATGAGDWAAWYDLIDRCDAWRPEKPKHSFNGNGRKAVDQQGGKPRVAVASQ